MLFFSVHKEKMFESCELIPPEQNLNFLGFISHFFLIRVGNNYSQQTGTQVEQQKKEKSKPRRSWFSSQRKRGDIIIICLYVHFTKKKNPRGFSMLSAST